MPLHNPNPNPRSAAVLQSWFEQPQARLILVDIGARGGQAEWAPLTSISTVIGFEADATECARMNQLSPHQRIYPVALDATTGSKKFYSAASPVCSGFRPVNDPYYRRFALYVSHIVSQSTQDAMSFDDWAAGQSFEHFDFLKVDTEGSELDILRGAGQSLRDKKCLGVLSEVWFEPDIKAGTDYGFAAMDTFLRGLGLRFFDMQIFRYPRSTLPVGPLRFSRGLDGVIYPSHSGESNQWGQVLTGNLLYFRDPVAERLGDEAAAMAFWDRETILRLLVLLDLYNYQDVALDVLACYGDLFDAATLNALVHALLPREFEGSQINLGYSDYWNISMKIFRTGGNDVFRALVDRLKLIPVALGVTDSSGG